jgi:hypothetical protein
MLDWLHYHYKLRQFQAEKKRTARNNAKLWRMAKQGKKPSRDLQGRDARLVDDDISQLASDYLERTAQRLLLPVPEFNQRSNKWEKSAFTERWRLTLAAIFELRAAIQAERREIRSWLAAITGLIGALIGLLSVILGRR